MNTITIEFCKEDRQRIDELIAFAGLIVGEVRGLKDTARFSGPRMTQAEDGTVKLVTPDHPADAPTTHLEPVEESPDKNANEAPEVKPEVIPVIISLSEFQKAVTQAVAKGAKQKAAAREIVNEYAPSVSEVPEDKRAEVIARLAKI